MILQNDIVHSRPETQIKGEHIENFIPFQQRNFKNKPPVSNSSRTYFSTVKVKQSLWSYNKWKMLIFDSNFNSLWFHITCPVCCLCCIMGTYYQHTWVSWISHEHSIRLVLSFPQMSDTSGDCREINEQQYLNMFFLTRDCWYHWVSALGFGLRVHPWRLFVVNNEPTWRPQRCLGENQSETLHKHLAEPIQLFGKTSKRRKINSVVLSNRHWTGQPRTATAADYNESLARTCSHSYCKFLQLQRSL